MKFENEQQQFIWRQYAMCALNGLLANSRRYKDGQSRDIIGNAACNYADSMMKAEKQRNEIERPDATEIPPPFVQ